MSIKNFVLQTLKYFKSKKYIIQLNENVFNPLAEDDILFVNSGLVGIYQHFQQDSRYNTLFTIQKCLRIAGKHNDFDEVETSNSHSTCFYMAGLFGLKNFNAHKIVSDIYEFIIQHVNKDNIYITVNPEDKFFTNIWQKINPNLRIEKDKDNFWDTGQNGLCGECSEIMYCDCNKHIEVWNIVHITHKKHNGEKILLDKDYIDSGGGLERLYILAHDHSSIYDIPEYKCVLEKFPKHNIKTALDGLKSIDAICNSKLAISNNKQGYVLKKLIRRVIFVLYQSRISITHFIHSLSHILLCYNNVLNLMLKEEITFHKCINKFKQTVKGLEEITEAKAIDLHSTHGIHIHLIPSLAQELNIKIGFKPKQALEKLSGQDTFTNKQQSIITFSEKFVSTIFLYNQDVLTIDNFIVLNESKCVIKKIKQDKVYYIIGNKCNVFPRMGGQEPDSFIIKNTDGEIIFEGLDSYKQGDYIFLKAICKSNKLTDKIVLEIDINKRTKISQNHSFTHILSNIISTILSEEIIQVSSYISDKKCKFSFFSYNHLCITKEQLEEQINTQLAISKLRIAINHLVFEYASKTFKTIPHKNYPYYVRTITIYSDNAIIQSKEICAGTHNVDFQKIQITNLSNNFSQNKHLKNIEFCVIN